ncbi:MAG: YihY/virulence factor BrkB family protein [Gammaproteobacteria bacterium]
MEPATPTRGLTLINIPPKITRAWQVLTCAVDNWVSDQASTIGAALAFYCAFSLAPLLIILVAIAGWIVGAELAHSYISEQLTALFGAGSAKVLLDAMKSSQTGQGMLATALSVVTLVIGASTVFSALQNALEQIWGIKASVPGGWRGFVRTRLLSFGVILALGFVLLVSLSITTILAALRGYVAHRFVSWVVVTAAADLLLSIGLTTTVIAMIYRYLPAKRMPWSPVLRGAVITALLFDLGRWAVALYLGRSTQPSAFGAAASFAALLLWLYYTAQIFLFGAELTACLGGTFRAPANSSEGSSPSPSAERHGKDIAHGTVRKKSIQQSETRDA